MDELISKQAAMKLLRDDWQASESRGDTERAEIAKCHYIEISNLPSAPPEPCEDAVSRKAVQYLLAHFVDEDKYIDACDGLKHLPPVTPKQRTDTIKAEIKRIKRSFTVCINSDYYTGYMSALSAVEGFIAKMEGDAE